MQQETPWEMTARQYRRNSLDFVRHNGSVNFRQELKIRSWSVFTFDPSNVWSTDIDRALEGPRPLCPSTEIVDMADDDGGEPAKIVDPIDCLLVEERYEIPQDVASFGPDEFCSLTDGELHCRQYEPTV